MKHSVRTAENKILSSGPTQRKIFSFVFLGRKEMEWKDSKI